MKAAARTLIVVATLAAVDILVVNGIKANRPADPWRPFVALAAAQAPAIDCRDNGTGADGFNQDKQLFWGELHLHTGYSLDAFSFGTRTTPDEAYLFAKGNGAEVHIGEGTNGTPGPTITLATPLDFVAITDHSEFLSVVHGCLNQNSRYFNEPACRAVRSKDPDVQKKIFPAMGAIVQNLCNGRLDRAACVAEQRSAWLDIQRAADVANNKCHFTSFVAYEWSDQLALQNGIATNHRNVIFANATVPVLPLSSINYTNPPELWTGLDQQCTGDCRAVTIPHNTNMSGGISLQVWDPSPRGRRQQKQYQVAAEIYQHKGASECLYDPATGFNEAECQFEQLQRDKVFRVVPQSFIRNGLARGLAASLVTPELNIFKLGFVGGTDGHNGAPGNVDEATWRGHDGLRNATAYDRLTDRWDWGPGGITGVWAEENSREAIFAAIQRRETYATSGPRMKVRVFQTSNPAACSPGYPASILPAAKPMGSTFTVADLGGAANPYFAIEAWPDSTPQSVFNPPPAGTTRAATIAAVQMIKIHVRMGLPPQVITETPIDVTEGRGFNPNGECITWHDRNFSANEPALYYVRVLQEQTWRWTHHDCLALHNADLANGTTLFGQAGCGNGTIPQSPIRERAWTSPIWYETAGLLQP